MLQLSTYNNANSNPTTAPKAPPLEVLDMKQKTKRVLCYLDQHGDTATTHDLTTDTELDNDAARYQLEKLQELGYAELDIIDKDHFKSTRATLTPEGCEKVKSHYRTLGEKLKNNSEVLLHLLEDLDAEGIIDIEEYREQFSQ